MAGRDTSRDGSRLGKYVLTHFRPLWRLAQSIPPLERRINKLLINRAVYSARRNRPHPLSLRSDYTSWESLTDRSYTGRHLPPHELPDGKSLPEIERVADLFRRTPETARTCSKSTLLFSFFAQWFTDGFLRTDYRTPSHATSPYEVARNTSNHEIDLSPLYGRTRQIGDALRLGEGGRLRSGMINGQEFPPFYYDDDLTPRPEFAGVVELLREERQAWEKRHDLPAEVRDRLLARRFAMGVERANNSVGYVAFNVLFLREHNRVCRLLEASHPDWDDERLYQTARNTVIVEVLRIVIEEYINHISSSHFELRAQPQSFYRERWYRANWMTMEFNLLYRWHSLVPDRIVWGGTARPLKDTLFNNQLLIDRGLGRAIDDASRQPASRLGLRNTPTRAAGDTDPDPFAEFADLVKYGTIPSLKLSRGAKLKPYNDYREYAGLPRVTDFAQITGNVEVQRALKSLYGRVDDIEYYTGLFAEDVEDGSVLPPLIGRFVAIDAFSQALTNPLLSEHVFHPETFAEGWDEIGKTRCLADVVARNTPGERPEQGERFLVSFTRRDR